MPNFGSIAKKLTGASARPSAHRASNGASATALNAVFDRRSSSALAAARNVPSRVNVDTSTSNATTCSCSCSRRRGAVRSPTTRRSKAAASEPRNRGVGVGSSISLNGALSSIDRGSNNTCAGKNLDPPRPSGSPSHRKPYNTSSSLVGACSTSPSPPYGTSMCHTFPVRCDIGFNANSMVFSRHCNTKDTAVACRESTAMLNAPRLVSSSYVVTVAPSSRACPHPMPSGTLNALPAQPPLGSS